MITMYVSAREEPVLGFQNGLRDSRISANVFPEALVVVGIVKLSAVNRPY